MSYELSNEEAEKAVVHSLIQEPEVSRSAVMGLNVSDMLNDRARAIVTVFQEKGVSDEVELATHAANELGEGIPRLLSFLQEAKRTTAKPKNIASYVELVSDAAHNRRAIEILNDGITDILGGQNGHAVVHETIGRLRSNSPNVDDPGLAQVISDYYDEVMFFHENPLPEGAVRGLSTGYRALDDLTGGLEAAFYIVGARPSVGKTALWTQIAINASRQFQGSTREVVFCTNEMSPAQLVERAACALTEVNRKAVREGRLSSHELSKYAAKLGDLRELPLDVRRTSFVHEVLKRAYSDPPPGLIVVDYLNKFTGGEGENRNQRFGSIASDLFDVSLDLEIPVVLLAQLNRDLKRRSAQALPVMEDLRDSGELEQLADVILMLHRVTDDADGDWDPHDLQVLKVKDRLGGGQGLKASLYMGRYGEIKDANKWR